MVRADDAEETEGYVREYFARLTKMSVIAAEVGISQAREGLIVAGKIGCEGSLRVTADLDEGLRAFREQMTKQKAGP